MAATTTAVAADYTALVQQIYIAYFGRPADTRGLANYTAQLAAMNAPTTLDGLLTATKTNAALNTLVNSFGTSAESVALYGTDTLAFVGAIYNNVLNRAPDFSGLLFWAGEIDAGRLSKAAAALNIAQGAIALAGADAAVLATKTTVATNFTAAIDTAEELLAYSGNDAAAAARAMLKTVTATTVAADFQATVTSTLQNLVTVNTPAPVGTTFTLTTGVDAASKFTGSFGDDIFNAVSTISAGVSYPTLTALDTIDGGAGKNTLNVVDTAAGLDIPASAVVKNIQIANIQAAGTLKGSVAGWTGLTDVTATQFGGNAGSTFTAASTTNVTLTDLAAAASTVNVQGGNNVKVNVNGVTASGIVNVGTATPVTGTVDVSTKMLSTSTGTHTADAINVKGGTVVTINADLSAAAGAGNTTTGGAIGVTGTGTTTTVSITQSSSTTAANEAVGVPYKAAVTGVTGAPGVAAVTAVSASGTTASPAIAGVVQGAFTVTDGNLAGAGSIKTVTLQNYGAGSAISSNALTNLNVGGFVSGTLTLNRVAALSSDTLSLTTTGLNAASLVNSTITDTNNEVKTLNVTVAGSSTLTAFTDTALTTLNVSGSGTLTMGTVNTSLTKIAVSGTAGFSGNVSALGAGLASFTTTSSGKITATMDATTQTFKGSTGQNQITITADATKAITAGSHTGDILVLNNSAATFNADSNKYTTTNVTGFETLGFSTASSGTYDMSTLPVGLKNVQLLGNNGTAVAVTKVASGATLAFDASSTGGVSFQTAAANGAGDSLSMRINTTSSTARTISSLTLSDANDVGIGTLSVASNISTAASSTLKVHTITTLVDNGLSKLNVTGNAGLTIGTINQTATQATSFTLNNTSTSPVGTTITSFTDANLGSLTFSGTGPSEITTLAGMTGKVLTIANTGTGTATVGNITAGAAANAEQDTVQIVQGLAPGEVVTVGGRILTNATGTTTFTATQVAVALSGGTLPTGMTRTGTLTGWTAAVTATDTVTFTSTTVGTGVTNIAYSDTVRPAATAVAIGTITQGNAGTTTHEKVDWTMQALTNGQSVNIDGLIVTAQRALTATEVAAAFTAGVTSAGNFTVGGAFANTATWTTPTFSNTGATLTLTSAAGGYTETDMTTGLTPVVSAAGAAITDATVLETVAAASTGSAAALQTITLTGNVSIGANSTTPSAALGATTGVTVAGGTNDSHINLTLNGAAATYTDTITLGNGNNLFTDNSTAGTVNVTVGKGGNIIDVNAGTASTFTANVTLGAHTNTSTVYNKVMVSVTNAQTAGFSTKITGATTGDVIVFTDGSDVTWVAQSDSNAAIIAADTTLIAAINHALGMTGMDAGHTATSFQWQGDTYFVNNVGAEQTNTAGTDSVVKVVGLHVGGDFGSTVGAVTLVS